MSYPYVSVCITTFNEKKEDAQKLLDVLNKQTLKPDEIILIDAKDYDNCSRSVGRNIAIKKAKNEIIAITDIGCLPKKDWLEKITKPFTNKNVDVVAGFYEMKYDNSFQKAERIYLGVLPSKFDENFLPSARSIAFTKSIWKKVGGFPENLNDTAEDTLFNVNLIKAGARFTQVKNAIVEWGMPRNLFEFFLKTYKYAKGDAESGVWFHPTKQLQSHNIKILSVFARYLVFIFLLLYSKSLFIALFSLYLFYAIFKAGIYGPLLQITSDFAVMAGFIRGIISSK